MESNFFFKFTELIWEPISKLIQQLSYKEVKKQYQFIIYEFLQFRIKERVNFSDVMK